MAWLKVEGQFPNHHKVLAAAQLVGKGTIGRVMGLWIAGACYAVSHLTDGFVPSLVLEDERIDRKTREVIDAMLAVGLLEPARDGLGYQLHDFTDYNPSGAEVKSRREWETKRKREYRQDDVSQRDRHGTHEVEATGTIEGQSRDTSRARTAARAGSESDSDSDPNPIRQRHDADAQTGARALGAGTPTGLVNGQSLRTHGSHAVCFADRGLCVPYGLHDELLGRLGGENRQTRLRAFYAAEIAALGDVPVGDDPWDFWRHKFAAWVGTVTSKPKAGRSAQTIAAVQDAIAARMGKAGV